MCGIIGFYLLAAWGAGSGVLVLVLVLVLVHH